MRYILAIDQGTSSTRAMLYSLQGELIKSSQQQLTQYYPYPGWVEHDPEEIWQSVLTTIRTVTTGISPLNIISCGITNQRETTLLWDKQSGECLARAIVWQDRRTQDDCISLSDKAELFQIKTGLLPDPYFSASKLQWLLDHCPQARQRMLTGKLAFGTIDSFLIWRLTGGNSHVTDITNASRTLLYNIREETWDEELLKLFNIPYIILPQVLPCDAHFGNIEKKILGFAIPITGVVGDQQAALIGQYCFEEGMIKATYGTGGFLLLNTGQKPVISKHKLLTTIAYRVQGKTIYGLEGSLYQAGTIIKWLRDEMKLFTEARDSEKLAQSLENNDGVYLVPSFTGLGAPHWLNISGAMIVGLSRHSTPAHFARAALESVCYQTRDVLDCMREDSLMNISVIRVDGGMAVNRWFLQYLSSQCGITVERPMNIETTALGAAIVAAIGCNEMGSLDVVKKNWKLSEQFIPASTQMTMNADYDGWQEALRMLRVLK